VKLRHVSFGRFSRKLIVVVVVVVAAAAVVVVVALAAVMVVVVAAAAAVLINCSLYSVINTRKSLTIFNCVVYMPTASKEIGRC
jgi:hypothetical protein